MYIQHMTECRAITKKGKICKAPALVGTSYCFWHNDPEKAKLASSKGGRSRSIKPFGDIRNPYDLALFLKEASARAAEALDAIEKEER